MIMTDRKRTISEYTHPIVGTAGQIFPLLCPVREYEWIEGWAGQLIYSNSGIAELDCVFTAAPFAKIGTEVWTCSQYEPPHRIDYVRFSPHTVIRLGLTLVPAGRRTNATALFVMTALDPTGDAMLADTDIRTAERSFKPCFLMLDHFLRTGSMLPREQALAQAALPRTCGHE